MSRMLAENVRSTRIRGWGRAFVLLAALVAASCSDGGRPEPSPFFVTADWVNRSLTIFSQETLIDEDASVASAIVGRIDLAAWAPGPIEVEVTPDGRTAVVAVGPGFFEGGATNALVGSPDVPGGGAVLLVDLDSLSVRAVVETRHAPMGIAITPDGRRAYTANYGQRSAAGDSVSVIDLDTGRLLDEFGVLGRPEQIAIDPTGSFALVNLVGAAGVRLFALEDPVASLTEVVPTGRDPSGLTFLGDADRAVVANSGSSDITLVATADPGRAAPVESVRLPGVPYGVTYMPGRDQVLAPTGVPAALVVLSAEGGRLGVGAPVVLPGSPFPMVAVADHGEQYALVPHMGTQTQAQLSIVDLDTLAVRGVSWLDASGPSWIAAWP